jgi:hypothetical protein
MVKRMIEFHAAPGERRLWLTLVAFVALGSLLTVLNRQLPIVRNALDYAKAALEISEHHFNLPVAQPCSRRVWGPRFFSGRRQ